MTATASLLPHFTEWGEVQHIQSQFHTAIQGCLLQQGALDCYAQSRPNHKLVLRAAFAFHGETDLANRFFI